MKSRIWPQVEQFIRTSSALIAGLTPRELDLAAGFVDDLGFERRESILLVSAAEQEFGLEIPDEDAEKIVRVSEFIHYLTFRLANESQRIEKCKMLALRVMPDGRFDVSIQRTDGTWIYADSHTRLASGVYILDTSRWAETLRQLAEMIDSPSVSESDLQTFFELHPDLLKGDDYDVAIPQARIVPNASNAWRADFVLRPFDDTAFCKVLELKVPSVRTVRAPRAGHNRFFKDLLTAIGQLRDYGAAFADSATRERFQETYGVAVYQPDLQLIVGRRWHRDYMDAMQEIQRRNGVRIVDWDSHFDALKRKFT